MEAHSAGPPGKAMRSRDFYPVLEPSSRPYPSLGKSGCKALHEAMELKIIAYCAQVSQPDTSDTQSSCSRPDSDIAGK